MNQRTQVTILIVVLAVLALIVGSQLTGDDSLLGPRGQRDRSAVPFQAQDVPAISMVVPGPTAGETFERERVNIFRYEENPVALRERLERERLEAERRKAEAEQARLKREAEAEKRRQEAAERERLKREQDRLARLKAQQDKADEPPPPPPEPEKPEPPPFPYKYDGLVGPKADAIAILRDREDDFAYARAGQVLDQAFRIEKVGKLKLVLSFTDPLFEGEFRQIPLRGEDGGKGPNATARQ